MGLIRAALGAAGGIARDQWKEFFYCESIPADVFAVKGQRKKTFKSSNNGENNIITNGSGIAISDGQCMMIVEQGKIVEFCAEPGEYTFDASTEPSFFDDGKLADNLSAIWENLKKRFTFGGEAPKDQRIYYFNTKEMTGNKFGTPNPVPFRVVDERAGIDIDIAIRCFGEYSIKLTNPMLFYTNVCGNFDRAYTRDQLESQMKTELLTALQPAFAKLSEMGIRYSALPGHAQDLADALNEVLSAKWKDLRGIEIVSCGVSSVTASDEDAKLIKDMQRNAAFKDPTTAAAYMVGATGEAMQKAASNAGGAAVGFMGMNMAQNAGGVNAQNLYAMGQQAGSEAQDKWFCPQCGKEMHGGNFCSACGAKRQ